MAEILKDIKTDGIVSSSRQPRSYKNSGYSGGGASRTNPALKGWNYWGGAPDDDIVANIDTLRQRSRDLYMNSAPVRAGIDTITKNVVGAGLRPNPMPNIDVLGMSEPEAVRLTTRILDEWENFAGTSNCDANRVNNFYELTQLLCRSIDISGDAFVTMPLIPRHGVAYDQRLQIIEADCICDPEGGDAKNGQPDGTIIVGGVEVGEHGDITAYYIALQHPLSRTFKTPKNAEPAPRRWVRIPIDGAVSGRRNILHIMNSTERPGQLRGVPLLSPTILPTKILDRYLGAELQAALIQTLVSVVFESLTPEKLTGELGEIGDSSDLKPTEMPMASGMMMSSPPGEKPNLIQPTHPYNAFPAFVKHNMSIIGAAMGVPYEMLMMTFSASYSASRAALNLAAQTFEVRRSRIVNDFCRPVWQAWMDEAVAKGYIYAPGYFRNPNIRRAYQNVAWVGPKDPIIDPVKEVQAATLRINSGLSTRTAEATRLTGMDFVGIAQQLAREEQLIKDLGISISMAGATVTPTADTHNEGDDDGQNQNDGQSGE